MCLNCNKCVDRIDEEYQLWFYDAPKVDRRTGRRKQFGIATTTAYSWLGFIASRSFVSFVDLFRYGSFGLKGGTKQDPDNAGIVLLAGIDARVTDDQLKKVIFAC